MYKVKTIFETLQLHVQKNSWSGQNEPQSCEKNIQSLQNFTEIRTETFFLLWKFPENFDRFWTEEYLINY